MQGVSCPLRVLAWQKKKMGITQAIAAASSSWRVGLVRPLVMGELGWPRRAQRGGGGFFIAVTLCLRSVPAPFSARVFSKEVQSGSRCAT